MVNISVKLHSNLLLSTERITRNRWVIIDDGRRTAERTTDGLPDGIPEDVLPPPWILRWRDVICNDFTRVQKLREASLV